MIYIVVFVYLLSHVTTAVAACVGSYGPNYGTCECEQGWEGTMCTAAPGWEAGAVEMTLRFAIDASSVLGDAVVRTQFVIQSNAQWYHITVQASHSNLLLVPRLMERDS